MIFGFIKKIFIGLLTTIRVFSVSSHTKCVSSSNQNCTTQPTIINLRFSEQTQGLHYFPFAVKLDRCAGSCNTVNK